MARQGATVVVTGRDPTAVWSAVDEISAVGNAWALPTPLDVAIRSDVDAAAAAVGDHLGTLDILINNAAGFVDWTESASADDLDQSRLVMDTNLYGRWNMIQGRNPAPQCTASSHVRGLFGGSIASGARAAIVVAGPTGALETGPQNLLHTQTMMRTRAARLHRS